ncbi:leucine-rich repeat-containing protein 20 [Pelodytes ibericus]
MAEAVARVARRVNEVVENGLNDLDLSECALNSFPVGLFMVLKNVAQNITSISLANNEVKSLTGKFYETFSQLEGLNLEGNVIQQLPDKARSLQNLKSINLSRNKFQEFPDQLLDNSNIVSINLEDNQIKDVPIGKLCSLPHLNLVNLKGNPLNKDNLDLSDVKFQLLI